MRLLLLLLFMIWVATVAFSPNYTSTASESRDKAVVKTENYREPGVLR